MRPLRVGVDLDGVGYDFAADAHRWFCDRLGSKRVPDRPVVSWDFFAEWGLTAAEFWEGIEEATRTSGLFNHFEPLPGYVEMIDSLRHAGHHVSVVTARPQWASDATTAWLERHSVVVDDIVLTSDKVAAGCDIHIDDGPDQIEEMHRSGRRVVVYDRPWNSHLDGHRIFDLGDFAPIVAELGQPSRAGGT